VLSGQPWTTTKKARGLRERALDQLELLAAVQSIANSTPVVKRRAVVPAKKAARSRRRSGRLS
jgi:hypothetical protein